MRGGGGVEALYVFNRDLRTEDNRALWTAVERRGRVAAVYVFDEEEMRERSLSGEDERLAFVVEALLRLSDKARLSALWGRTEEVIEGLIDRYGFKEVYMSHPHSWGDERKVGEVARACAKTGARLLLVWDNALADYRQVRAARTFSAFYAEWRRLVDLKTRGEVPPDRFVELEETGVEELARRSGWRSAGRVWRVGLLEERLRSFRFEDYARLRDLPGVDGTSRLSPFIALGLVSVRRLFALARGRSEEFVRQLAWREYYYCLRTLHPYMRELELKPYMRRVKWNLDEEAFRAFAEARTGYPIVDAGVRQLLAEGWVHNRVRLLIASFLVKDLHVDWRRGERFFALRLVDYDDALNVGNWQWASSVGVDPLPLRVFNPMLQSRRLDPDCRYIKRYVPELEGHPCKELHDPLRRRIKGYHEPVVDHYEAVERFRRMVFG